MSILITGASGFIGRRTARALLAAGTLPSELQLITRAPEKLEEFSRLGAQVCRGDFGDTASLPQAFAGGTTALLISVAPEGLVTAAEQAAVQEAAIAAAADAGVQHAVLQSSIGTTTAPQPLDEVDRRSERALRGSGMDWTLLRTAAFADSRGRDAKRILREGRLLTNLGAGRAYYVTRDDIALAAAAVLAAPHRHRGRTYNLVGQSATAHDLAQTVARIGGRPIEVVDVDDAGFIDSLTQRGRMLRLAQTAALMHKQFREGHQPPPCDLPGLIGRGGTSVIEFLAANAEELLTGSPPAGQEPMLL